MARKKKAPKEFQPTSAFAPLQHGRLKGEPAEPSTADVLKAVLSAIQDLKAPAPEVEGKIFIDPPQAIPPVEDRYSNARGFPRTAQRGGDKGEVQWFDDVNNEWRTFDGLMARIGQLEAFKDWANAAIKDLQTGRRQR